MSALWKVSVVLGIVFTVGCGAATAQYSPSPIAPPRQGHESADDRLDAAVQAVAQQKRGRTADDRLDAAVQAAGLLQEGDAIKLVQFELRKSLNNCASLGPYRCSDDQVLKAFGGAKKAMPSLRVNLISTIGKGLLEQGEWTAVYESDSRRWRVEVGSSAFHVYETTLIVEGVGKTFSD